MSQIENLREYTVAGMTCEHCVLSVTEEVSELIDPATTVRSAA